MESLLPDCNVLHLLVIPIAVSHLTGWDTKLGDLDDVVLCFLLASFHSVVVFIQNSKVS